MSDLFKSAFDYFSGPSSNGQIENSFVGQVIEIQNVKLKIKKVLAEGGFAVVFVAQDVNTGVEYALKRLLAADEESKRNITQEINILRKLSGHPNIIQYLTATCIDKSQTQHGQTEFLLITELCTGGSLVDTLKSRNTSFDVETITKIFYQTTQAVCYMHSQTPKIIHRDLKIDNLLISKDGKIKLCDFGSATSETFSPDVSWSANQRTTLEENLAKFTTPMYRAPEMVDIWNNYFVGAPVDVWALGCILYTLCFMKHPFEDAAKLRIVNANYTFPPDPRFSCFHDIIRGSFQVNPATRITANDILERLAAIAESNGFNLKSPLNIQPKDAQENSFQGNGVNNSPKHPPHRPPPPAVSVNESIPVKPSNPDPQWSNAQSDRQIPVNNSLKNVDNRQAGLFSSIKGGAGSFFKNLKDTSTKVMATVQQSMGKSELDISYVTSRIIVMPLPSEGLESAYRYNNFEDIKLLLDSKHPNNKYSVYNLSGKTYHNKFGSARVINCKFAYPEHFKAPLLNALYQLCEDIYQYLSGDSRNVVVIHCLDGKATSATLFCGLLIYASVCVVPEDALQIFAVKRCPPNLKPSELRYLYYLTDIINKPLKQPHFKPVQLVSLQLQPIPAFTKVRDGCRPYLEIYSENRCILSTLQDYEQMRLYNITEGKCILNINASVCGDVCIIVYHARNVLGSVMSQGRLTGIKICQIQLHTGFIPEKETSLIFTKSDLDELTDSPGHFVESFKVTLNVFVTDTDRKPSQLPPWVSDKTQRVSDTMFTTTLEKEEIFDNFISKPKTNFTQKPPERPPLPPKVPPHRPAPPPSKQQNNIENASKAVNSETLINNQTSKNMTQPIEESVDLLNLNSAPPSATLPKESPSSNFDLLSSFEANFNNKNSANQNTEDLFAPLGSGTSSGLLDDWTNVPKPPTTTPVNASNEQKSQNIFSGLDNLSGFPFNQSSFLANSSSNPSKSSPQHHSTSTAKSPTDGRADYSRSNFDTLNNKNIPENSNKPKANSEDIFRDLLGSQGFNFSAKKENTPRTINAMRKEELATYMDPEKMKVMEWTEGKKNNLRALLCSLHTVLWEDAKWNKCEMHQLVSTADVKKAYRKACLAVHPDKQTGTENENLAKLIFVELNNAWSDFENSDTQQNMFAK